MTHHKPKHAEQDVAEVAPLIPLYIPSRSRADRIAKGVLTQIPREYRECTAVCVPEWQVDHYSNALIDSEMGDVEVVGLPDDFKITETRHWIGSDAARLGHSRFMMIDDDVKILQRKAPDNWQLEEADIAGVRRMLAKVEDMLSHDPIGMVGLSAREGNNRSGLGGPDELIDWCTRIHRSYAWRTDVFLGLEFGRVQVMEDFDLALQALRKGFPICALAYWATGQKMTQDAGGASEYRTREVHDDACRKLCELHPAFASPRLKRNTSGGGLAERLEATIWWKAAYGRPLPPQLTKRV